MTWNIKGTVVTDEQVAIAKSNGLERRHVKDRLELYWSVEDAISTPLTRVHKGNTYSKEDEEIARRNGIRVDTFRKRVYKGMDPIIARSRKVRVYDY